MSGVPFHELTALAKALGGEVRGGEILCPGPGHSARDRSLAVRVLEGEPRKYLVYSFAGDDTLICRQYVAARLGSAPSSSMPCRPRPRRGSGGNAGQAQENRAAAAARIWRESQLARGTIVEAYLISRGLDLEFDLAGAIRFHPGLPFENEKAPTMVCLLRDLVTDAPCGIHRTFLDRHGRKQGRRMLGRAFHAAVKLDADEEVTLAITIGEGIETCLAARQLGLGPVWAVGSAAAMGSFPVLAGIDVLRVLAEHDDNGANAVAAAKVGARWLDAYREALVIEPPSGDMNDVIKGAGYDQADTD